MIKLSRKFFAIVFIALLSTAVAPPLAAIEEETVDRTPEPYSKDEFPLWQRELRRFEIITLGSLPFITMFSFWGYDIVRSIQHKGDPAYYPWPMKRSDIAVPMTSDEQMKVFFTAVGVSVGIALFDVCFRAIKRSIDNKKLERENIITEDAIQLVPYPNGTTGDSTNDATGN